jgi:uncharacterized protein DUF6226
MSERLRHAQGPPPDAYSRVTNAERFRSLHRIALERLEELRSTFDVERLELDVPDPDMKVALVQASIRLAPREPVAAPIVLSLTEFPGLYLRCGRWLLEVFPACGCDACEETLEGEAERFLELVENVVAGRFHEAIEIPAQGDARLHWSTGSPAAAGGGWTMLDRQRARELVGTGPSAFAWQAWPHR